MCLQATAVVKEEISPRGLEGRVYMAPTALRKRVEVNIVCVLLI